MNGIIYRCPRKCTINKKCFILKARTPLKEQITVVQKCKAERAEIQIEIGGERPP